MRKPFPTLSMIKMATHMERKMENRVLFLKAVALVFLIFSYLGQITSVTSTTTKSSISTLTKTWGNVVTSTYSGNVATSILIPAMPIPKWCQIAGFPCCTNYPILNPSYDQNGYAYGKENGKSCIVPKDCITCKLIILNDKAKSR